MIHKYYILLYLLLIPGLLYSQGNFTFTRYDATKGLSENHVITILQDKEGFLWFGTMGGLNRFDGNDFKVFASNQNSPLDLYNHRIHNLWEDQHQNIWIMSFGNTFQKLNKERNKVTYYPQSLGYEYKGAFNAIEVHEDGFTVMAFDDIGVFIEKETEKGTIIEEYLFDDEILTYDIGLHSMYALDEKNIFLVTFSGPVLLKIGNTNSDYGFYHLTEQNNLSCHTTNAKIIDSLIYFTTTNNGILVYNINTGVIKGLEKFDGEIIKSFTNLIAGIDNSIWFSTKSEGFIGIQGNEIIQISSYKGTPFGLISDIFSDKIGNIWFSSINFNGVFRYGIKSKQLEFYPVQMEESLFRLGELSTQTQALSYLYQDSKNIIWIGTRCDGILRFDPVLNKLQTIKNDPNDLFSISTNDQLVTYEDRSNNLWFGTKSGGVNKLKTNNLGINLVKPITNPTSRFDNKIHSVYRDSYGNLWTSTKNGKLYIYNNENQLIQEFSDDTYPGKKANYKNSLYFCMLEDSKGRFWIGSKGEGLHMTDLKSINGDIKKIVFRKFEYNESIPNSLQSNEIYDLHEDNFGQIWIATYGGGLGMIPNEDTIRFINYDAIISPLLPRRIHLGRYVISDKQGRIWYGGMHGACSFEIDQNNITPRNIKFYGYNPGNKSSLVYNDIKCLFEDSNGMVWIGTWGGGVSVWDPKEEKFIAYTVKEGLPNDIIYGIKETSDKMIWLSTENGLSRFNPETKSFRNFYTEDGLPTNSFTEAEPYLDPNGTLYFGTMEGIISFKSPKVIPSTYQPEILLTKIFIDNEEVEPKPRGIIDKGLNLINALNLNYNKNSFRLQIVSTDYTEPEKTQFSYFLEGYDRDWNQSIESNSISYYQIPPGKYNLKIRSTNRDGIWSEHQKVLPVIIHPPWWKSKLAFLIYFLLGTVIFLIGLFSFRRFYRLQHMLQLEKKMTRFKLRFFTNLSHEFRTPLSLIINPVEELKNSQLTIEQRDLMNLVHKNARYLMGLINQILDFRTLQEKQSRLKITQNDVYSYFMSIAENFTYVANKGQISYQYFTNVRDETAWFDTEKLEKIMTNLLSNAFKYTNPGGRVTLMLILDQNEIKITVEDTGKGIEFTQIPNIYKRYSQLDDKGNFFSEGTGIGLSLVKEFVTLHKGKINVNSKVNHGSKFEVVIPCSRESYSDKEIVARRKWVIGSASDHIAEIYNDTQKAENGQDKARHSVLIVEDDPELRGYLLSKFGNCYNAEAAKNGKEGLEIAKKNFPDIIVSDNIMPEMTGIEMTHELKSDPVTSHIPIIILSVKYDKEDRINGLETGADDYIEKPFDLDVLFAKVHNIIKNREMLKAKFTNELDFELPEVSTNQKDKDLLEKIEKMILEKIDDPNFLVQDLYTTLGFSKTVFFNKIKAITGIGPKELIKLIKLKEAARLLATEDYNISEVCYLVGYSETNYFRTLFKDHFKMTPSEFIKMRKSPKTVSSRVPE